jgi:hypothetical protein
MDILISEEVSEKILQFFLGQNAYIVLGMMLFFLLVGYTIVLGRYVYKDKLKLLEEFPFSGKIIFSITIGLFSVINAFLAFIALILPFFSFVGGVSKNPDISIDSLMFSVLIFILAIANGYVVYKIIDRNKSKNARFLHNEIFTYIVTSIKISALLIVFLLIEMSLLSFRDTNELSYLIFIVIILFMIPVSKTRINSWMTELSNSIISYQKWVTELRGKRLAVALVLYLIGLFVLISFTYWYVVNVSIPRTLRLWTELPYVILLLLTMFISVKMAISLFSKQDSKG